MFLRKKEKIARKEVIVQAEQKFRKDKTVKEFMLMPKELLVRNDLMLGPKTAAVSKTVQIQKDN
jgi:hypothetical protein